MHIANEASAVLQMYLAENVCFFKSNII